MKIALFVTGLVVVGPAYACDVTKDDDYALFDVSIERAEEGFVLLSEDGTEVLTERVSADVADVDISGQTTYEIKAIGDEIGAKSCYCKSCTCQVGGCSCWDCEGSGCPTQKEK